MKNFLRSIAVLLLAAVSLLGQGVVSYPFTVGLPPSVPSLNVSCSTTGVAGSTTYFYWVVPIYPIGQQAPIGFTPSCVITNANATLNGSNFDVISWIPVTSPVAVTYAVLRNTTSTFPGTGTTAVTASTGSTTVNDQSNSLNSFTFTAAQPFNGALLMNNISAAVPFLNLTGVAGPTTPLNPALQINGVQVFDNTGAANSGTVGISPTYSVYGSVTVAQINAGITVVPATAGRTIKVLHVLQQSIGGAATTCTAIQFADTSNVVAVSSPVANLTQNTIVTEATASETLTTFLTGLTAGAGLKINQTGSACTVMTSMNYEVIYTYQ